MAWDEAKYIINKVLAGVKTTQITGIPPRNMESFSVSAGNAQVKIRCIAPDNTVVEGQLVCTVKGVQIVRKIGSAPKLPNDGTLVADIPAGSAYELVDTNLVNGVTYYYAFFPYSDHGVYNYNQFNVKSATPSTIKYWGFKQNFADKNPSTTITYLTGVENENYQPMMTNEGAGTATAGDWLSFLQEVLKNFPYMVQKTGQADYALNPDDYTQKKAGGNSDYNVLGYNGGAFAWLNKIWMKEEYAPDGESREVRFANGPAEGYYAVGFYDQNETELEGVWIPMGLMDASGRTLIAGTTPCASKTCDQEKALIDGFSSRAVFLGGPILNVLRDLEYMLFKSTDIQATAGYGRCNAGSQQVIANQNVANGNVPGFKGTGNKTTMNKYFHSQVLGSYQQWLRDPYTILVNGALKVSPFYKYDITGATYDATSIKWTTTSAWKYPSHTEKVSEAYGSLPKDENTGTTATGLCDGVYGNAAGTRIALRLGTCNCDLLDGPANVLLRYEASGAAWDFGVGVMLLPPAGYAPEVQ